MMVPSPFLADLVLFAPYTQTSTTLWAPSGLQRTEYEVFYKTAEAFMLQKRYATPGAESWACGTSCGRRATRGW